MEKLLQKKAQDPYSSLVLLLKAFALPENAERAMESLRRMVIRQGRRINDDTIFPGYILIPEDIYPCFILGVFLRGCEVLSSQEKSGK